jgi:hypothetical protein
MPVVHVGAPDGEIAPGRTTECIGERHPDPCQAACPRCAPAKHCPVHVKGVNRS